MAGGRIVFASPFLKINTWRSLWPARELRRRGVPCVFVGHDGERGVQLTESDVLVLHASNQDVGLAGTVQHYRRKMRGCWVEFDDDYTALGDVQDLRAGRVTPHTMDGIEFPSSWFRVLTADHVQACRAASGVIASTPVVADAYRRWTAGESVVIRNWLPRWVTELRLPPRLDPPCAGWFGHLGAHRRDVRWLASGGEPEPFGVLGAWVEFAQETGYTLAWTHPIESDQRRLYRTLGRLSVGVAPLVDDRFNRSKSWIKPLEYGALGIPCVASDVAPYRALFDDGFPVDLCDDPRKMVQVTELALALATQVPGPLEVLREHVRDRYTLEGRGGDEWQAWAEGVLA